MTSRVTLVTGGTGGIGTEICRKLSTLGYNVVAGYCGGGKHDKAKRWQQEQQEAGYDIDISYADLTNEESCLHSYLNIKETKGPIEVLINNAGITADSSFKKMTYQQWKSVIDTNLTGVFNITQRILPDMLETGFGRIVNISSINGQKGRFGQTNYAAAKAGLHGFTKSLALEVARKGITVNTLSPGYVETKMIMAVPEEARNAILKEVPVGRFAQPEEIAHAISFLISEQSGYMTGSNLSINGGQHTY